MTTNAWVFSGGDFNAGDFQASVVAEGDIVVGVDHGIEHCLLAGLVPTVLMGDFDSIDEASLNDARLVGVQKIGYPARKNQSDLQLALEWLNTKSVDCVTLLGVSGGRSDHHLFNWLLPLQQQWNFSIEFIDASVHAHVVESTRPLKVSVLPGQTISILPLPEATGVSTHGLEYPLTQAHLTAGSTLGLSNVAAADDIGVSLLSGRLLVFRVKSVDTKTT